MPSMKHCLCNRGLAKHNNKQIQATKQATTKTNTKTKC